MLTTQQKVFRRFWYATCRSRAQGGPKPFTLLGEKIVMWLDDGRRAGLPADRCCHRTAKLSKGWCENGHIVCGYHGWTYDRDGNLVRIPQFSPDQSCRDAASGLSLRERYGYAWVASRSR